MNVIAAAVMEMVVEGIQSSTLKVAAVGFVSETTAHLRSFALQLSVRSEVKR